MIIPLRDLSQVKENEKLEKSKKIVKGIVLCVY